jgi:succinate dehydrogenase / fumarate reductase cytochrome b subunit
MSKANQRPLSPYMLGPYYRFEFQTVLSFSFRLTGIFMSLILTPLACVWMLALALGGDSFSGMQAFMATWVGTALGWVSALVISYHVVGGIRHLVWDMGLALEKPQIISTGIIAVIVTLALWSAALWGAS